MGRPNKLLLMPTPLSSALAAKVKADKLTLTALAEAIGASVPSVTTALKGKSFPNKSTAPKFAKFLGITVEELLAMKKGKLANKAAPIAKTEPGAKAKPAPKVSKSKPAKAKPAKPAKYSASITIAEAVELAADALAVAVHGATAEQRRVITAVLGG